MNKANRDVIQIHYDVTLACQNRCEYCYALSYLDNSRIFNEEVFNKVRDEIAKLKNVSLSLLGGEPLLSHVERYSEFQVDELIVYSNMNFGEKKFREILSRMNYPFRFITSFHQSSDIEDVKRNVLIANEIRPVEVSFLLSRYNFDFVYENVQWALEHNLEFSINILRDFLKEDMFTEIENEKYQYMLERSMRNMDSTIECTIDDVEYTSQEAQRLDFKNISRQYYVQCQLSILSVSFEGLISAPCGYDYKSHIDNGIEIKDVFCSNHTCRCDITSYKKLLRSKNG